MKDNEKTVNPIEERAYEMLRDPRYADLFDPDKTDADVETLYDSEDRELSAEDAEAVRYARANDLWGKMNAEKNAVEEDAPAMPEMASGDTDTPEVSPAGPDTNEPVKAAKVKPDRDVLKSILNGEAFRARVRDNR